MKSGQAFIHLVSMKERIEVSALNYCDHKKIKIQYNLSFCQINWNCCGIQCYFILLICMFLYAAFVLVGLIDRVIHNNLL